MSEPAPTKATSGQPLLDVRSLTVEFPLGRGRPPLRAVDDVTLSVPHRETVGLVGESGSGKTTIGRAILGLVPVKSGTIMFAEEDITHAGYDERRRLSKDMQVVFQDPYSSLNPSRTIGQSLAEVARVHENRGSGAVTDRVHYMLSCVGLPPESAKRYPSSFSGGQRQRIAVARALMVSPRLVICDEPVSALDLSVQAQVLNLLQNLQTEFQLSYLFVAHDLSVVRHLSHRIIVLYRGRVMEDGPADMVYQRPAHPYTRALLEAEPVPDPLVQRRRRESRAKRRSALGADVVGSREPNADACVFASRCPHVIDICLTERPPLDVTPNGSLVACHRWADLGQRPADEDLEPSGAAAPGTGRASP